MEPGRTVARGVRSTAKWFQAMFCSVFGEVVLEFVVSPASHAKTNKNTRPWRSAGFTIMAMMAAGLTVGGAHAQQAPATPAPAAPAVQPANISVELNKLETQQSSCRAYLVVDNQGDKSYDALKLDLVLFQTDGIIGRRFALDLAPIKGKKRSVKLFDLDGVKCEAIGSFLINDILDCKAGGADESGCLDRLALSTRSNVQLTK